MTLPSFSMCSAELPSVVAQTGSLRGDQISASERTVGGLRGGDTAEPEPGPRAHSALRGCAQPALRRLFVSLTLVVATVFGVQQSLAACLERTNGVANLSEVAGREVYVPLYMIGSGVENALSFSIAFDSARLTYVGEQSGAASSGASLMANTNLIASGKIGYVLAKPAGQVFGAGSNELIRVRFRLSSQPAVTAINFADSPIAREVVNGSAATICSEYQTGSVSILTLTGPSIAAQPQSRTIEPVQGIPTNATFSVTAAGSAPLAYQWRFNSQQIPWAKAFSCTITNVTSTNAGAYDVVVTNDGGAVTSSPAVLTVLPLVIPPSITLQPRSQIVSTGETLVLNVQAAGTLPLRYQWTKAGANISDATNSVLAITNVTSSAGGTYAVKVTNSGGTVASQNAVVTVSTSLRTVRVADRSVATSGSIEVPVELVGLGDENAIGFSLQFDPARVALEGIRPGIAATGAGFLVNSNLLASGTVGVAITRPAGQPFPAGTSEIALVRFRAGDVSGPASLVFADQPIAREIADSWGTVRKALFKDGALNILATAPSILAQPQSIEARIFTNVVLEAQVAGSVPLYVQWQKDGLNLPGQTSVTLSLNNVLPSNAGAYRFILTNAVGAVTSAVANVTVARAVRIGNTNAPTGNLVDLPVELLCAGDENALGFTLNFSPSQMTVADVIAGPGLGNGTLNANTNESGKLGLIVARADNAVFPPGTQQVARVRFLLNPSVAAAGARTVSYGDSPVAKELVDANARTLLTHYIAPLVTSYVAAPVITKQPTAQSVTAGNNVSFSVETAGSKPMTWQWFFNGSAVQNATNSTLTITNVQSAHAGNYTVQVNSPAGSTNSSSALLTVIVPRPDFFVNNVQGPSEAMAGQLVQVRWDLFNVGNGASAPGWHHTVWLARDSSGSAAEFVSALPYEGTLAANQSLSVTGSVIIPATAMGDRYLMIRADGSNAVTELNEANNMAVALSKIHITSGDLVLRRVTAPSSATVGTPINVDWVVANEGLNAASVVWRDSLYLSTNASSVAGATKLLSVTGKSGPGTPGSLGAGGSYTNTQSISLPSSASIKPGNYYIVAVADVFNDLPETQETNNAASTPIQLTAAPLPDLAVLAVLPPADLQPGSEYSVAWAITNQGNAAAVGQWREALYASNAVSGFRQISLWDFTNNLAPAASLWRTQAVVWPFSGPAGQATLIVAADIESEIEEQAETNNLGAATSASSIPLALAINLPFSQIAEDNANPVIRATVTRNGDIRSPLVLTMSSSDSTGATAPASVTIAAGQDSVSFDLTVRDDNVVTPTKVVTITAAAAGYPSASTPLSVINTDVPKLTLFLDTTAILEGQSSTATVTRDVVADQPVTVLLQSSAPNQLSLPLSVTIPAGAPSWTFSLLAVDDDVVEANGTYTASVSAAGFNGSSAEVTIVDNDLPVVTLALADHSVSEGAGAQATFATLKRTPVSSKAVTIELESSDPAAARPPVRVVIQAYAESASFPIAAVDDDLVDGPQSAQITPYILTASGVRMGSGTPDTLAVTDNDGPTLLVTTDKKLLAEGLNPAATVKVTRNTPATNALVVALQSSIATEATVPPSVTIPMGTNAGYGTIATIFDGVNDGDKTVSITASAAGFTSGSANVVVSDTDLPDLAVPSVTLPATVETEGYFSVSFRVENQGLSDAGTNGQATPVFTTRVYLSKDAAVGDDVLVGQFPFTGRLMAGAGTDQSLAIRAPLNAGQYWIIVQTDAGQELPEIREDNNTGISATPVLVMAGYEVTVQTDVDSALKGTQIPMTGVAYAAGGLPAVSKPVNIHVITRGTDRVIAAITGPDGTFSANWVPLPGEAGVYDIFATHPGVSSAPVQDRFRLLGMHAQPGNVALTLQELATGSGTVRLVNDSDQPLTSVTATVLEKPADLNVSVNLPAATLPGNGYIDLAYTFTANTASAYGLVKVRVTTAEGLALEIPFAVSVAPLRPHLVAKPSSLLAGMARGRQTTVELTLVNDGSIPTGPLSVVTPNLPWLAVVSPNPIPSIAPGETNAAKVTLLLRPAADLPLGPYDGSIAVNGTDVSVTVPFTFRALSEAKGDLLITAVDELTYYAEGAPKLAGASVTVADAVSHETVATGITDANGQLSVTNLPEAYYEVSLTAEKHVGYRNTHLISAGLTNEVSAFLSRQVVTYTWTVEPVSIEDNYKISIETTFETVVPLPVVTIEPAVIDLGKISAEVTQVELKISNEGLIAANNTRLSFPTHPRWKFEPLLDNLGVLPAKSSLTIPLIIRKVPVSPAATKEDGGACHLAASACWDLQCGGQNNSYCGGIAMPNANTGCGATSPTGTYTAGGTVYTGGGSVGGGSTTGNVYVNMPSFTSPTVCDCDDLPKLCVSGSGGFSVDGFATKLASAVTRFLPNFSVKEVEVKVHADGQLCSCCKNNQLSWEGNASAGADVKIVLRAGPSFSGSLGFDAGPDWSGISAEFDAMAGIEITASGSVSGSLIRKCAEEPDACLAGSIGLSLFAGAQLNAEVKASSGGVEYSGSVSGQIGMQGSASASISGCVKDGIKMSVCGEIKALANASGSLSATIGGQQVQKSISMNADTVIAQAGCSEGAPEAASPLLAASTGILPVQESIDVTGSGIWPAQEAGDTGILPADTSLDPQASVAEKSTGPVTETAGPADVLTPERDIAEALGITSVPPSGICAHVKLKTEQSAVISRDAFRATLEIGNADTVRLEQLQAEIIVRDESGAELTQLFGIRSPELIGITAVDGTGILPAQSTGTAKWTIIPTSDAAPTASKQYLVSGKLRYTQGGAVITVPLAPVAITVLPNPKLIVHYFHDRDVFSDDPFTDVIEPSIPFNLAVMIQNTGYGTARNMRITSAQPQIVENEKGLLVDFKIIATEVAGQNMTPTLTANFGDINPNSTVVGRWLMTSTLQGLFIDYKASFEHVDALNNPKLSLIDSVHIHEMNHLVYAAGAYDDGKPDFLVNEIQDLHDYPDTLWLSDGSTLPVAVVEQGTADAPASGHLQVQLAAQMPQGWAYLHILDPGNGKYRLKSVQRSDGAFIGIGTNVWTTDRTFVGFERPPVRENILHLLDYNSTGSYTLTYEALAPADTTAPISSVIPLPAQSSGQIPVSWGGQDDTGADGVAYFDIYVSVDGGLFKPWLLNTTTTAAVYPGAQNSTYAFYSIATDRAGNRETAPSTPDAQTTVNIVNRPPTIGTILVQRINEGTEFNYTVPATDPDLPSDRLTYSLSGQPAGMLIDAASGAIRWLTSESTGPSTNTVTVTVRDNGSPQLSATSALTVIVDEVNQAPTISLIADRLVNEGALLTVTNSATDTDLPANQLTWSLGGNVPTGLTIDAATGVIRWRPTESQGPSTNLITVRVTDNGTPQLSATREFAVLVRDMLSDFTVSLGSTNVFVGETNTVPVVLRSSLELANLSFRLQTPAARLSNLALLLESPEIISAGLVPLGNDTYEVNFSLDPKLNNTSVRQLASLRFEAVNTGHSAIVPLRPYAPAGSTPDGRSVTNATVLPGRVIVIGAEPILTLENAAQPQLTIYGHPGKNYSVLAGTNVLVGTTWTELHRLTLPGRYATVSDIVLPAPPRFLRAMELPAGARLQIVPLGANRLSVRFEGDPGTYILQSFTNLAGPWSNVATLNVTNSPTTIDWTNQNEATRFFRLEYK